MKAREAAALLIKGRPFKIGGDTYRVSYFEPDGKYILKGRYYCEILESNSWEWYSSVDLTETAVTFSKSFFTRRLKVRVPYSKLEFITELVQYSFL